MCFLHVLSKQKEIDRSTQLLQHRFLGSHDLGESCRVSSLGTISFKASAAHITTYYNILQHITYMYSIYIHPCKFHVYKRVMFKTCACIEEDGITISWVDQAPKLEPRMTRTRRDNWKRFGDFTTERIQRKVPISSFRLFPWSSLVVCLQWSTARCTWNQHEKAARTRVCSMATEF